METTKVYLSTMAVLGVMATLALAAPAMAATTSTSVGVSGNWQGNTMHVGARGGTPGVFGTVASVSGTTLTVTSKMPQRPATGTGTTTVAPTPTTYTVDASSATVTKNNATSTVSAISVGDMVMVQGTVSGTNVTATKIRDGMVPMKGMGPGGKMGGGTPPNSVIQGNGEPVVGGSVTAITGSTLTITNKSNVTYSVDATNATIDKGNATSTLSSVVVGDTVLVQGSVNGSSVTASSVIDQGAAPTGTSTSKPTGVMGFFSGIGGFFAHLFGF